MDAICGGREAQGEGADADADADANASGSEEAVCKRDETKETL